MTNPEQEKPAGVESSDEQVQVDAPGAEGMIGEDTVPILQTELEQALADADRFRDAALRAEAEMQNVRRRAQADVEKAHKYALERFIQNLLPVADSLEKAVESAEQIEGAESPASKAIIEGIGLCQKLLLDQLAKEGVSVVDPHGAPFDPNHHQAMSMVENGDLEPNTVVAVIQKGFTLNERLVRPAMVIVSKAPQ